ncbi:MAG: hypothetical protein HZA13_05990 [Nitrospirae bacterium]|nr:hypothetical protein [Nitrospirota bacterium]
MIKKTEERKDKNIGNTSMGNTSTGAKREENGKAKDIYGIWAESYTTVSKLWEDSYLKHYKPWMESTTDMFEKAVELPGKAAPGRYKEFYDEWQKTYQNTFGKFYPVPTLKSNKETLEKLLASAEESNKVYKSWIAKLEENSQKTREILKGEPDPLKYTECYDMWIKSYGKIFDELLSLPATESTKEVFEKYTGIPNIYLGSFVQMSKLWKNLYSKLYGPWIENMMKLSGKMAEISRGKGTPEAYKGFYDIWMATYEEAYGKYAHFMQPSEDVLEAFGQNTDAYLNTYKSWVEVLEKMSEKAKGLSKQTTDPEALKEFYALWVKMYEKAFSSFFENMPAVGMMKEMMDPVKIMSKIYGDTYTNMLKMWTK